MEKIYTKELKKLAAGLIERDIPFQFKPYMNGGIIIWNDHNCDAICHDFSYGKNEGLLEIMGDLVRVTGDTVEGYLTAEEIFNRIDKKS